MALMSLHNLGTIPIITKRNIAVQDFFARSFQKSPDREK